ncbi:MAG TPA: GNAT family N-acetyltransferase, partial [Cyanobacteria bacterium UBA12227]|nr:GNAT family N-acetyltransferase [Cyanobacteria bacterium UBA12227]
MGFWKSFFGSPDTASTRTQFEGDIVQGMNDASSEMFRDRADVNTRILFSTERDIDLYELEEL